jgi:hypothetical protein
MASHTVTMLSLCKLSGTIFLNCELVLFADTRCVYQVISTSNTKNTIHVDDLVSGILSPQDTSLSSFRVVILP